MNRLPGNSLQYRSILTFCAVSLFEPPLQASSGSKPKIWPTFAYLTMIIYSGPKKNHSRSFKNKQRIPLEAGL